MNEVFAIANEYVEAWAALDPFGATDTGLPGHDSEATDFSPDGIAAESALRRNTIALLEAAMSSSEDERRAQEFMLERLRTREALHDAGEDLRALSILRAPSVAARRVFDLMPKESEDDWNTIGERLRRLPASIAGFRARLSEGIESGLVSARRQALECARQAEVWAGADGRESFFQSLVARYGGGGALAADLGRAATAAAAAYAGLAVYLRDVYAPAAAAADPVGEDRYRLHSRQYNGCDLDLRETYEWGWQELERLEREAERVAAQIAPGATVREAIEKLRSDPESRVATPEPYRAWLQEIHDQALAELNGRHFDIPAEIRRMEVVIPPPGGALAPYYTAPSEDFELPGRTWWPLGAATFFPKWDRVTIAYHEGVPGHHLQVGGARCLGDRLSRYQKTLGFVSGYGEGWALYAERLMGELGYLEEPGYRMGMLKAQAFRAYRVVVDIGMHLGLAIPRSKTFHPGEVWDHDLAIEFGLLYAGQTEEFLRSEVVRYLGLPGQAISYKVGEREWLRAREGASTRLGAAFDLKAFHTAALDLGPLTMKMLPRELERALPAAGL